MALLESLHGQHCSHEFCDITTIHWHCDYCKESQTKGWNRRRKNCSLCSAEKTAKTKLSSVRGAIKNLISFIEKPNIEIIEILKSSIDEIKRKSNHFHGTNEDIEMIIDNYFDKSKKLPLISVNNHNPVDLNYTRKKSVEEAAVTAEAMAEERKAHLKERLEEQKRLANNPEEIYIAIGKEVNIPMWAGLSKKEQNKILNEQNESATLNYFQCVPTSFNGIRLFNFLPSNPHHIPCYTHGQPSEYTLNVNTLKPTKNSPIQTLLSDELCRKIKLVRNIINFK